MREVALFLFFLATLPLQANEWKDLAAYQHAKKSTLLHFVHSQLDLSETTNSLPSILEEKVECVQVDLDQDVKSEDFLQSHLAQWELAQCPAFVLLNEKKELVKTFTYIPRDTVQFADDIVFALAQFRDLSSLRGKICNKEAVGIEVMQALSLAQDLCREDLLAEIVKSGVALVEEESALVECYRIAERFHEEELVREIQEIVGKRGSAEIAAKLALIRYQALSQRFPHSFKALQPLKEFLEQFQEHKSSVVWQVEMVLAQHYTERVQWEEAYDLALQAVRRAPVEKQGDILHTLDYMKGLKELAQK